MEEHKEKQIDLRQYLGVMIKRRWVIITVFSVLFLTVAVNTFTAVPIYQATARIGIEKEKKYVELAKRSIKSLCIQTDFFQKEPESSSLATGRSV